MTLFIILVLLAGGLVSYILYRKRTISHYEKQEISHFSSIGFPGFFDETVWKRWEEKVRMEGTRLGDCRVIREGSGPELWIRLDGDSLITMAPFFRSGSVKAEVVASHTPGPDEWHDMLTSEPAGHLVAERIPPVQTETTRWCLAAFGKELTLYDSPDQYEFTIGSPFKMQLLSVSGLSWENGETSDWSADVVVSGLIASCERRVNSLTGEPYWLAEIEVSPGKTLTAVWDYRLCDRFPQKKNVAVGRFYLFSSPEGAMDHVS
ncbi:MAG: hypothetical protein HUU10_03050 [Bacteroidetes bacterium]|nr:hypothetical protein [Bacteroidota bacterium]